MFFAEKQLSFRCCITNGTLTATNPNCLNGEKSAPEQNAPGDAPVERIKEILTDTSGIIGASEDRAKWKQYYENERELAKAVAAKLENGNEEMTGQKKSTWLQKIKDALRYIFTDKHGKGTIPDDVIKRLAKAFLPNILAFFESEKGRRGTKNKTDRLICEQAFGFVAFGDP